MSFQHRGLIPDSPALSHPLVVTNMGLTIMQEKTLTSKYSAVYFSPFPVEATLKYRADHGLLAHQLQQSTKMVEGRKSSQNMFQMNPVGDPFLNVCYVPNLKSSDYDPSNVILMLVFKM